MVFSQILDKSIQYTTLTAYSLPVLPKNRSHLQRPVNQNYHFGQKMQHFSGDDRDKNTAQNSAKHVFASQKIQFFFWGGGMAHTPPALPQTSLGLALHPPEFQPDLRHCCNAVGPRRWWHVQCMGKAPCSRWKALKMSCFDLYRFSLRLFLDAFPQRLTVCVQYVRLEDLYVIYTSLICDISFYMWYLIQSATYMYWDYWRYHQVIRKCRQKIQRCDSLVSSDVRRSAANELGWTK